MVSKKSGLVATVLGILSIVFSATYISSCTKPLDEKPWTCNYVVCTNGGLCDSGKCVCPVGYEGKDCSVKTVKKFYGFWRSHFKFTGSDSANLVGKDSLFDMELKASATNTSFFIYSFFGNPNYSNVLCIVDSANTNYFRIDTTSAQTMYYDHFRIRGGWAVLYGTDSIAGSVWTRSINRSFNWQNDTFNFYLLKK